MAFVVELNSISGAIQPGEGWQAAVDTARATDTAPDVLMENLGMLAGGAMLVAGSSEVDTTAFREAAQPPLNEQEMADFSRGLRVAHVLRNAALRSPAR
jgi:hypothetical protein